MIRARLRAVPRTAFWLAILLLGLPIGVFALRYVTGDPALLPWELRVNLLANPLAFVLHTSFGGPALLAGPWQFVRRLRRDHPSAHRWLGRFYVSCCLVSGLAAYPIALGTVAGPLASAGFA